MNCDYCGTQYTVDNRATIEHIIPKQYLKWLKTYKGIELSDKEKQINKKFACELCNRAKSNGLPTDETINIFCKKFKDGPTIKSIWSRYCNKELVNEYIQYCNSCGISYKVWNFRARAQIENKQMSWREGLFIFMRFTKEKIKSRFIKVNKTTTLAQ